MVIERIMECSGLKFRTRSLLSCGQCGQTRQLMVVWIIQVDYVNKLNMNSRRLLVVVYINLCCVVA